MYGAPAHLHVRVTAPGYQTLTTELFIENDQYLDNDAVFGVKDSLVLDWRLNDSEKEAEELGITAPFNEVDYDIVLHPAVQVAQAAE